MTQLRAGRAVEQPRRDKHTAGEADVVGKELGEEAEVPGVVHFEDADVRPAAGSGGGDDLRSTIPVDIGRGHENPAGEAGA